LLQPQDRRAPEPGDSRAAALARRRSLDGGLGDVLLDALFARIEQAGFPPGAAVLDAGCGEGFFLAAIAGRFRYECWGVDISAAAIDLAAKRYPDLNWVVANADRRLPFADGSFHLLLSIFGRKNPSEFHRVLLPEGRLLLVVPAEDDLAELREAVLGKAVLKDRGAKSLRIFEKHFELETEVTARSRARLDAAGLEDLLRGTYLGARHSERKRFAVVKELEVTQSYRLLCFRPRV
jgi:23S rRNA (guanine745-N1)-methyltransferase